MSASSLDIQTLFNLDGKIALVAHVKDRPDPVVTNAWARLSG